ncbi:Eco57I restriction-modification methylase domain-containing protein [Agromyces sp. NPDC058484]|uniref:Eco57I restriction-modification methylase domain-containing protein n=1 Tax=Agromyces sp. NPDC058484 TaxID=3346524 RepID=UPI00364E731D
MSFAFDAPTLRKGRGAFFTPLPLAAFLADWAITSPDDRVLEPSCGDAVFLQAVSENLRRSVDDSAPPRFVGFDIHGPSVIEASERARSLGVAADIREADFFTVDPTPTFDAVIGNPPFIRFQGFAGDGRRRAIERALAAGVNLSGLASSWAAFVVHATQFLRPGGRLGMVLPAELLSVNYAAPVRAFLLERFTAVELVTFERLQFDGIQADVVLLLAGGNDAGGTDHFTVRQVGDVEELSGATTTSWAPDPVGGKWTGAFLGDTAQQDLQRLADVGALSPLGGWGRVTSGAVTGRNSYFTLAQEDVVALGIPQHELVRILPPGLSITSVGDFSRRSWERARDDGRCAFLLVPGKKPSPESARYMDRGRLLGVPDGYKCRVRQYWWRTPGISRPDFFVSYMSGHTPRVVKNSARVANLNGTHGLALASEGSSLAKFLPVLSMSSMSLLSAETVGRTYGGGVLKMEPTEAARWLTVSPAFVKAALSGHASSLAEAHKRIQVGDIEGAQNLADLLVFSVSRSAFETVVDIDRIKAARHDYTTRRVSRARRA